MIKRNPLIYEINTWAWLNTLSQRYGEPITLASVPQEVIGDLLSWKFDAVWLMGVWKRSPGARQIGREHPGLQHEYSLALPDLTVEDVVGSPYAVHQYAVDPALGGRDALATFRAALAAAGVALILDYVPNHVAIDHHWTMDAPEALLRGTATDLERRPGYFFHAIQDTNDYVFAHGRDPHYPAWSDTAQVDAFSPQAREQATRLLLDVAEQCDGVRCDMAMLMVSRVFGNTWNRDARPETEFWEVVIPAVRARHPDFVFMAEVYWDMEGDMIGLGFDYTYDKHLYDRLRDKGAGDVRDHLLAGLDYQHHMVRFTENHDERRAAEAFGPRSRTAAALSTLLPGASLLHEGQFEGWRRKLPVQLGRRFPEPADAGLIAFYKRLVAEATHPVYHEGTYLALAAHPILGNDTGDHAIIAFAWAFGPDWRVIVANYSEQIVSARVMIPNPAWNGPYLRTFIDALTGSALQIAGDALLTRGLEVGLPPWGVVVYRVE